MSKKVLSYLLNIRKKNKHGTEYVVPDDYEQRNTFPCIHARSGCRVYARMSGDTLVLCPSPGDKRRDIFMSSLESIVYSNKGKELIKNKNNYYLAIEQITEALKKKDIIEVQKAIFFLHEENKDLAFMWQLAYLKDLLQNKKRNVYKMHPT